jgi:hypothetical protein
MIRSITTLRIKQLLGSMAPRARFDLAAPAGAIAPHRFSSRFAGRRLRLTSCESRFQIYRGRTPTPAVPEEVPWIIARGLVQRINDVLRQRDSDGRPCLLRVEKQFRSLQA